MSERDSDELEDEFEDEFEVRVRKQTALIEAGKKDRGQSFWLYVGLIGMVGWSVVLPMLLGVLVGRWIDRAHGTGYSWSLGLFLLGLAVGCFNAWRSIMKEQ